jgi:hypothetical protein
MDTSNPAKPLRLTAIDQQARFPSLGFHSIEWAKGGTSPWLVAGTEIAPGGPTNSAGSDCDGENSVIETWDARKVVAALKTYKPGSGAKGMRGATFTKVDAFKVANRGLFLDGAAPGTSCTARTGWSCTRRSPTAAAWPSPTTTAARGSSTSPRTAR